MSRFFDRAPGLVGGKSECRGFRVCEFDGDVLLADGFCRRGGFGARGGGFGGAGATSGAWLATGLEGG